MPKQLINIIGVVVVVAVLVAGSILIALPMFLQSVSTAAEAVNVSSTNALYAQQVAHLQEEEARLDETTAEVASLRAQIPAIARNDDVFEIVGDAANASGATVVSVTAAQSQQWALPTGPLEDSATSADPAAVPVDGSAPAEGTAQPADDAAAATSETATGTTDQGVAPAEGEVIGPEVQIPYSISVKVDNPGDAARFLDALSMGPRLVSIVSSTLAENEEEDAYTLDVEALALVRTES